MQSSHELKLQGVKGNSLLARNLKKKMGKKETKECAQIEVYESRIAASKRWDRECVCPLFLSLSGMCTVKNNNGKCADAVSGCAPYPRPPRAHDDDTGALHYYPQGAVCILPLPPKGSLPPHSRKTARKQKKTQ